MKDRFNFRCWDKENKKFLHNLSFDISTNETLILNCGIEGKKYINLNDTDRYTLMQCTGLKDKNGKLIYEGDVVRFEKTYECACFTNVKVVLFKIVWCDYGFMAKQIKIIKGNESYEFPLTLSKLLEIAPYTEHQTTINLEVIGNIYENPELLKECEDE